MANGIPVDLTIDSSESEFYLGESIWESYMANLYNGKLTFATYAYLDMHIKV